MKRQSIVGSEVLSIDIELVSVDVLRNLTATVALLQYHNYSNSRISATVSVDVLATVSVDVLATVSVDVLATVSVDVLATVSLGAATVPS
ncbi:hypothetical protein DY000_02031164 [Brassica cretica]|uniref:Uncharacterized protein n=1 Tax=Brassica cretica TaxID=69181 RepID=A0ABQ7DQ59_BRACR|nr:hypothetical protein DY000_02031164 [Brassica cretica]